MNVAVRHRIMQIEDFLAWEARQEGRYEYDGREPVEMVGGSHNHARLLRNLAILIGGRLMGGPFEFFGSDLKLVTSTRIRYPDGQVVETSQDGEATFLTTPLVVFEVTSPSTEAVDHGAKAAEYCAISTVQNYVILEQFSVRATVYRRTEAGWMLSVLEGGDTLTLPAIGVSAPLDALYEGVAFPKEEA